MATAMAKYKISNLNPNIKDAFVVCLIIEKSNYRLFDSKYDNGKKGVITLTVRDSERHFINCVVWGSDLFVESYDSFYKSGDVVAIVGPSVVHRIQNGSDQFKPLTSSPYELSIREGYGKIIHFDGDVSEYLPLKRAPLKSTRTVLSLNDASLNISRSAGDLIDVLVIVRSIKPIKLIKTKNLEELPVREVILMDKSSPGMLMALWKKNLIERSAKWQAMNTVLHIISVRIDMSSYHKTAVLAVNGRTLITENPNTKEANDLKLFALAIPNQDLVYSSTPVDLASITKVMSVQQVLDRIDGKLVTNIDENQFTAVVYGLIIRMDFDSCKQFVIRRCTVCQKSFPLTVVDCPNEDCCLIEDKPWPRYRESLELHLEISDHTGTLPSCRMVGDTVERTLGHNIQDLRKMDSNQLGSIKSKWFLERCRIKLSIQKKSPIHERMFVKVVECTLADPVEVADKIKIY